MGAKFNPDRQRGWAQGPENYKFWQKRGISADFHSKMVTIYTRAFQFAIRIDSIRYANRFESIRLVKKSAFRFTSSHAVFFLFIYCIVSAKK